MQKAFGPFTKSWQETLSPLRNSSHQYARILFICTPAPRVLAEKKVNELYLDPDILTRSCPSRGKQSHLHAGQIQLHGPVTLFPPFALSSPAKQYTPSFCSHTSRFAAVIDEKLLTEQLSANSISKTAIQNVLTALSSTSGLLRIVPYFH